jgi:hypothetical protein
VRVRGKGVPGLLAPLERLGVRDHSEGDWNGDPDWERLKIGSTEL